MLKKFRFLALASILFSSFIISCGDDAESSGGAVPATGKVTVTLNGTKWEGTNGVGVFTAISGLEGITVGSSKLDGSNTANIELISITIFSGIDQTLATGDYNIQPIDLPKAQVIYTIGSNAQTAWVASSGTVTLSKMTDTNYQGTFSGTLTKQGTTETMTMTNGGFNVNKSNF